MVFATGVILKESSKKETDRLSSGFAAPEIYKGVGFGAASDIYSYAAVLYFAATGKTPSNSLQGELLDAELAFLEEGETVFAGIIRKSMAFLSQDRIQSMQELIYSISAFSTLISNQEPQINKKELVKPPKENKRRKSERKLVPIASVLLCVIAAAMLWKPYVQPEIDARNEEALLEEQYIAATALMEEGRFEEAMEAFAALTGYGDSDEQSENCRIAMVNAVLEEKYQKAKELASQGEYGKAAIAFAKLDGYKDARDCSFNMWKHVPGRHTISMNFGDVFAIRNDGTVVGDSGAYDKNGSLFDSSEIEGLKDIVSVCGRMFLRFDGTVYVSPDVFSKTVYETISGWTDIVSLSYDTWNETFMGLKADGSVVAVSSNPKVVCNLEHWSEIVAIANSNDHFLGVKADGTVVAYGCNDAGQCNVDDWDDVKMVAVGRESGAGGISFGLKTDGTIIAIGSNYYGCITKVKNWSNIQAIHMGPYGIDSDGNIFSAMHSTYGREPVNGWRDIVDISATYDYRVGLKSDGSLVFGLVNDLKRFANARTWTDIQIP